MSLRLLAMQIYTGLGSILSGLNHLPTLAKRYDKDDTFQVFTFVL